MLVVTTENIPGKKYEVLGEVFGVTTQSKNFVRNIGAGLKNIVRIGKDCLKHHQD